ncbi:MAG: hypothetical protein HY053_08035 [Proteobacteria bacterium]|nr:hypothetical protein [Pseudomonadota bacterium]
MAPVSWDSGIAVGAWLCCGGGAASGPPPMMLGGSSISLRTGAGPVEV